MSQAAITQPWSARTWNFSNPTLLLCVAGILLPNALFLGAMIFGIGAPPRPAVVIACASLAWIARITSPFIFVPLYFCILAYDVIFTIARSFNLMPNEIALALNLGAELNLLGSPLYLALIAGVAMLIVANLAFLIGMRNKFRDGNTYVLIGATFALVALDYAANASPHYQFGTYYGANKKMESASVDSGFRDAVLTHRPNNVLMVMVEALGMLTDPAKQAILMQSFRDADLLQRYDVKFGTTTYYGSTTAGEMRELCNSRESFQVMKKDNDIVCLPEMLRDRGYRTVSMHNFTGIFFDRPEWYPNVGLEKRIFAKDLHELGLRQCGVAFRGACDVELVPLVAKHLRDTSKPNFFYWMTLSTHTPVAPRDGTPRLGCDPDGGAIGHREVCYMVEMWIDLFEAIARMTADIPPTEILLVGDHAPPLWSKAGRGQFEPGKVPWIRLTPRGNLIASQAN